MNKQGQSNSSLNQSRRKCAYFRDHLPPPDDTPKSWSSEESLKINNEKKKNEEN